MSGISRWLSFFDYTTLICRVVVFFILLFFFSARMVSMLSLLSLRLPFLFSFLIFSRLPPRAPRQYSHPHRHKIWRSHQCNMVPYKTPSCGLYVAFIFPLFCLCVCLSFKVGSSSRLFFQGRLFKLSSSGHLSFAHCFFLVLIPGPLCHFIYSPASSKINR